MIHHRLRSVQRAEEEAPPVGDLWVSITTTTTDESVQVGNAYTGPTVNGTIDWGDGSAVSVITSYNDADKLHVYASPGTYLIKMSGPLGSRLLTPFESIINSIQGSLITVYTSADQAFKNVTVNGPYPVLSIVTLTRLCYENCLFTGSYFGVDQSSRSNDHYYYYSAFKNNLGLTSFDLDGAFGDNVSFYGAWYGCSSLVNFGAGLFNNLSSVPENVFFTTWFNCFSLSAQSVENILTSIAYACDNNGLVAPESQYTTGYTIDIPYNTGTGPLSAATNTAIATCKTAGFIVKINGTTQ